jgi:hypothetical protein
MARGGHGLAKVSPGTAMPDSSMPFGGGQPAAVFYPFGHPRLYAYVCMCTVAETIIASFLETNRIVTNLFKNITSSRKV